VTPDVIAVAVIAGLAGGAIAAAAMGALQAWMARPKGTSVRHYTRGGGSAPTGAPPSSGRAGPFDRFSDRGKRVLALAQDEAIRHNHNYIGTEHLLSALLRDGDTVAARALNSLGIDLAKVRTALEFIVGRGDQPTSPGEITLSPRTKKVIELSIDEARRMGQQQLGPEHILLGLIREGEGIASGLIESLGVTLSAVRTRLLELLAESGTPSPAGYAAPPPTRAPGYGPFSRFTDRAKRVLALAQDEAIRMGHIYIGPEHLLLGLARLAEMGQPDEAMKRIFATLGVSLDRLRTELGKIIPPSGHQSASTEITLGPETKEIMRFVNDSAPDKPVVPEDILMAIVRDEQSFAVQILARLGVTPERVRAAMGH
jgi:ATP-dependent Clp protease ATP-binding subunit ClpA